MNTPDFPLLDAHRAEGNTELSRVIMDAFGNIEPYIDELDYWCSMPVRLVHNIAAGWHLEVGPYGLAHSDIQRLRQAIAAYDQAAGTTTEKGNN